MIVYITRHGQPVQATSAQKEDPEFPLTDRPLSALGREQARRLGERLQKLGFTGTIYASPYRRTAETADVIAEVLDTVFYPEVALREIVKVPDSLIDFRGLTLDGLRRSFPHVAADAVLPYPWWTLAAETSEEVLARVRPFLERLLGETDGDVLLVGHGASVGASTRYFLEGYPDVRARLGPGWNCALTAIQVKPRMEPILLRDTAHLAEHQVTSNATTRAMWEQTVGASTARRG